MARELSSELQAKRFQRAPWSQEPSIWDPWLAEKGGFEPRQAWPAPTYQYWWPYPFPPPEVPGMPSPSERLENPEGAARRIGDLAAARSASIRPSPSTETGTSPGGEPSRNAGGAYGTGVGVGALALLSPLIGSIVGKGIQRIMGGGTPTTPPQVGGQSTPSTPFQPDVASGVTGGGSFIGLSPVEMEQAANVARTGTSASGFEPFIPNPTAVALGGGSASGVAPVGGGFDPYSGVHAGFEQASTPSSSLLGPTLAAAGTAYGIGQMAAAGEPTYGGMSSAVPGALSLGASLLGPAGSAGPVGLMAASPFLLGSLVNALIGRGGHTQAVQRDLERARIDPGFAQLLMEDLARAQASDTEASRLAEEERQWQLAHLNPEGGFTRDIVPSVPSWWGDAA